MSENQTLEPKDKSDVGQSNVFCAEYGGIVKYTTATKFLVYDGKVWHESEIKAQGLSQELTDRQLEEARSRVERANAALTEALEIGIADLINGAKARLTKERQFHKYVISRRKTSAIAATLTEARPKLEIRVNQLDADGELLNTPGGTVNLRTGEIQEHRADDYCTKITTVSPNDTNAELYGEFLKQVTCEDKDLESYLQEIAGAAALGTVKEEMMVLVYGTGGNGKSTLFNLWLRVLGDYGGTLSAETLTANCRKNASPEFAELRGKRLVIAAELGEGQRLDTGIVKKLCSTDEITAEKKYKDPFRFRPSHLTVLYTNFLPKINTNDSGTWDRIKAIPFKGRFRGARNEVKDYCSYLYEKCGGAVLEWMIEGAKRYIENGYKITLPEVVKDAINQYQTENDWLTPFVEMCCDKGRSYTVNSGNLYQRYRTYCKATGEYCQSQTVFNQAREAAGFPAKKTKLGMIVSGLKLNGFIPSDDVTPFDEERLKTG